MSKSETTISELRTILETSKDDELEVSASSDNLAIERALKIEEYKGKKQDREQRKDFAGKIFNFLMWYMIIAGAILFLSGAKIYGFQLNDIILVTLLGTTTVNVIGLFIVVAKYLFPQHNE